VRVPRRPDARMPVHAGDHSALPVQGHGPAVPSEQFPQRVEAGERALEMAVRRMGFSARAHDRILKVARTIAEAVQCRGSK